MAEVCILTTAHPVDDVRVDKKIGRAFLAAGFRVTWIGPDFAYNRHEPDSGYTYRTFRSGKGRLGRLVNIRRAHRAAKKISGADVFYSPDPDAAFIAVRRAKKVGAMTIFDIHEAYHKAMLIRWVGAIGARIFGRIVKRALSSICRKCDIVIGVSDAVLDPYLGISRESRVVKNCPTRGFAWGKPADVCGEGRIHFTVMHGKNFPQRGTGVVLDAFKILRRIADDFRVVMFEISDPYTKTNAAFRQRIDDLGLWDMIDLRRGIPNAEMPSVLASCDAGLIVYGRELGEESLPNRLFEYMAAGLPVIAPSYSREIVRIIETEACGLTIDAENPDAVAEAIMKLRANVREAREMGRRAREAFFSKYNWEAEATPLIGRIRDWSKDKGPDTTQVLGGAR